MYVAFEKGTEKCFNRKTAILKHYFHEEIQEAGQRGGNKMQTVGRKKRS